MKEVHLSYRGDVDLHLPVASLLSKILSGPPVHTGTQVHPPQDGRSALQGDRNKLLLIRKSVWKTASSLTEWPKDTDL